MFSCHLKISGSCFSLLFIYLFIYWWYLGSVLSPHFFQGSLFPLSLLFFSPQFWFHSWHFLLNVMPSPVRKPKGQFHKFMGPTCGSSFRLDFLHLLRLKRVKPSQFTGPPCLLSTEFSCYRSAWHHLDFLCFLLKDTANRRSWTCQWFLLSYFYFVLRGTPHHLVFHACCPNVIGFAL